MQSIACVNLILSRQDSFNRKAYIEFVATLLWYSGCFVCMTLNLFSSPFPFFPSSLSIDLYLLLLGRLLQMIMLFCNQFATRGFSFQLQPAELPQPIGILLQVSGFQLFFMAMSAIIAKVSHKMRHIWFSLHITCRRFCNCWKWRTFSSENRLCCV